MAHSDGVQPVEVVGRLPFLSPLLLPPHPPPRYHYQVQSQTTPPARPTRPRVSLDDNRYHHHHHPFSTSTLISRAVALLVDVGGAAGARSA
jgi:hypothetical protein